jgi:hypothetical protein
MELLQLTYAEMKPYEVYIQYYAIGIMAVSIACAIIRWALGSAGADAGIGRRPGRLPYILAALGGRIPVALVLYFFPIFGMAVWIVVVFNNSALAATGVVKIDEKRRKVLQLRQKTRGYAKLLLERAQIELERAEGVRAQAEQQLENAMEFYVEAANAN